LETYITVRVADPRTKVHGGRFGIARPGADAGPDRRPEWETEGLA